MQEGEKMEKINEMQYKDVEIGHKFSFKKIISEKDIDSFSDFTGDYNPLHNSDKFAKSKGFGCRVVHGMLAASYLSTLFGMIYPGKNNLYLSQSVNFKRPIYSGVEIIIEGRVNVKHDATKCLEIGIKIYNEDDVFIEGNAKIMVI